MAAATAVVWQRMGNMNFVFEGKKKLLPHKGLPARDDDERQRRRRRCNTVINRTSDLMICFGLKLMNLES